MVNPNPIITSPMDKTTTTTTTSAASTTNEDPGAPESWEVADVEESMKRLLLSPSSSSSIASTNIPATSSSELSDDSSLCFAASSSSTTDDGGGGAAAAVVSDDAVYQVDQFLRDALQNPRERLSVLRMEQDVIKFIQDPLRQQLEFQQLPTSYLRLAAHRVAQHYFLQSMVLLDNSLPDGSGSRIIVRKTSSECRLPRLCLADIPVTLPQENSSVVKVAIKQRPQKNSALSGSGSSGSQKGNNSKSVEERKEEYNRARARIFSSSNLNGSSGVRTEIEPKRLDNLQPAPLGVAKVDEKFVPGSSEFSGRATVDSSVGSSRPTRNRVEKDPVSRHRPYNSNRVAIFRDREIERKDPDYDRSYDRYMQRFDPGFGFAAGHYAVQPMYAPAINYNTEFPQLGSAHVPQVSTEPPRVLPQHLPGTWTSPSNPTGLGYGHPETMMTAYSPNHINARSASAMYLHAPQFPCQHPGMPFIHAHEHIQTFPQSQQQQHDSALGLARPR